jgi:hypothetical protein
MESINERLIMGIASVQDHFMMRPDGIISNGSQTHSFICKWKIKPVGKDVSLRGGLQTAWDLVNPLLPNGSYCSSGFRSIEHQRRILHDFYRNTWKSQIIKKYGQEAYSTVLADLEKNEAQVLKMVKGVGQAIAAPGKSKHQQGKALDIGGPPSIDQRQYDIVTLVARANPAIFSGVVLKERNGCVHFEIR